MALSPAMICWVAERIVEALAIIRSPHSTPSQRTVARHVLATWAVR